MTQEIINTAIRGGYSKKQRLNALGVLKSSSDMACDPKFWHAIANSTGEKEWEIRHNFFGILFNDDEDPFNKGWPTAVRYLSIVVQDLPTLLKKKENKSR